MDNVDNIIKELINKNIDKLKNDTVIVNGDMPFFSDEDSNILEGQPKYYDFDEYDRSNGAIALISVNTIAKIKNKHLKYLPPHGWQKTFENKDLFEKCHIIAYSLSAKLVDEKNIFIGTKHLNTSSMKKIENKVKKYIQHNNTQILYRVTIKYKGKNQIPTGILIEAQSTNDDFNLCRFCYNIENGVKFKYVDGTIIEDNRLLTKLINKIKRTKNTEKTTVERNENYIIDIKSREYHLLNNSCTRLTNLESKYMQETTTKEKELLKEEFKPCRYCIQLN